MTRRPQRVGRANNRRVSVALGSAGRLANSLLESAACVGIAKRRGVLPAFPSDWIYRRWFSFPDEWFVDDLTGTIPANVLATSLPPAMRPYLQSLALWSNAVPEVREMLQPSPLAQEILAPITAQLDRLLPRPLTFIHVRRGDTVTRNPPQTLNPLPSSYFVDAAMQAEADSVIVFSDEPKWVLENLPDWWPRYEGEPGPEDTEPDYATRERRDWIELFLMANCDRAVISNSSYGLLGAWMGQCETWFPSRWFGEKLRAKQFNERLIIPPEWHEVKVVEDD